MELKYSVGVKYSGNHTRFGTIKIEIQGETVKELLQDLSPIIMKWQNKATRTAKEKYGNKGKLTEVTLEKIDLTDEFGDTLDVCYECGKVVNNGNGCPDCGVTF